MLLLRNSKEWLLIKLNFPQRKKVTDVTIDWVNATTHITRSVYLAKLIINNSITYIAQKYPNIRSLLRVPSGLSHFCCSFNSSLYEFLLAEFFCPLQQCCFLVLLLLKSLLFYITLCLLSRRLYYIFMSLRVSVASSPAKTHSSCLTSTSFYSLFTFFGPFFYTSYTSVCHFFLTVCDYFLARFKKSIFWIFLLSRASYLLSFQRVQQAALHPIKNTITNTCDCVENIERSHRCLRRQL